MCWIVDQIYKIKVKMIRQQATLYGGNGNLYVDVYK